VLAWAAVAGRRSWPINSALPAFSPCRSEGEGFRHRLFERARFAAKPVLAGNRDGSVIPSLMGPWLAWWIRGLPLAPPLRALLEG